MERPLSSGDLCEVINGLAGRQSLNVGKLVTIDKRIFGDFGMDHTRYGPMYSCIGQELMILTDGGGYQSVQKADFPGIWLKRIDPLKLKDQIERVFEKED
jgi:hypothetical protein